MNAARKLGSIGTLILSFLLVAAPSGAQKSLSDGVDELAAKLAKSYGDGQHGKVAIVPLRELGGGENLLGTYIAETLTNSFFDVGYRDIVERQMLDRALQELKLSLTGMIDTDSAKKIGKFLHADLVVGGTMTDFAGEVSVNCRMFAVETGQVVAVATTKIVKDDSVKSMLAKRLAVAPTSPAGSSIDERSADGGEDTESPPSGKSAQPTPQRVEQGYFTFELRGCTRRGDLVRCSLAVTNVGEGRKEMNLCGASYLVDPTGRRPDTRVQFDGGGCGVFGLEPNLPRAFQMSASMPRDAKKLNIVLHDGNWFSFSGSAIFRDVPIASQ
jgi:hypothetical protein